jgi:general secretion pathway protein L
MSRLSSAFAFLARWIDDAAIALARAERRLRPGRRLLMIEEPDGEFRLHLLRRGLPGARLGAALRIDEDGRFVEPLAGPALKLLSGSRVEVVLSRRRFVFRPLELPRRAGEFLDGVVRSQIDRLTPWNASDAAYGWSPPVARGPDHIEMIVAAVARAAIAPIARALTTARVDAVEMTVRGEAAGGPPIAIYAQRSGDDRRIGRLRRRLVAGLALASLAFVASAGAAVIVGGDLDARNLSLQREFAERRAAMLSGGASAADEAVAALEAKKRTAPSAVMAIETLSRILPDDTYLTELRIEDSKVEIVGQTRDAPALIRLIEQSRRFSRATFFAPTTRGPNDSGDSFHIEANVEPTFGATN